MNIYSLPPLISALAFLFLGIFTVIKGKQTHLVLPFFVNCLLTFWWQICWFVLFNISDEVLAYRLVKIGYSGIIFLPASFFYLHTFILELDKKTKKWINIYWGIGFVFLIILWTSNMYIQGFYLYFWGYYPKAGILHPIYLVYLVFVVVHCYYALVMAGRRTQWRGIQGNQSKYLMIAFMAYCLAASDFAVNYGIEFYPLGFLAILVSLGIIAYAIFRYHLLEIEVIIRKTLVFAGLSAFVFGAFVGTAYLAQTFWTKVNGSEYLAMAIAVLVIVLVQEPLKNILIKYTDRFLLQKKYDYQKILKDASEGMAMVRELKWLLGLITHIVSSKMRVSNIGIFLQEDDGDPNHYYLKAKRGKEPIEQNFLSSDNPICLWLKENKRPLVLEEVDYLLQRKKISSSETSLKNILVRIKNQMEGLNAKIILPSFYKGGLLGFLSLGYKLSGDIYTKEDLVLLSTLSNSSAIAIENARLFDNLIDEIEINNHLRKEEEESYMQMMMSLAKTIDAKDSYTYDHVEMVYQYGVDLSQYLPGVNKDALKASLRLHDLGKIGVPDSILSKQSPLTPEEWKKIKDHTILGARILAPLKRFEYVAKVILHHQEKFDGTGYPAGLKGDQIPLESRIIAVVDAYHAMISDRPYRKALPKQAAIAELRKFSGTQFDPIVVEAFLKLLEEKYGITETA